MWEPDGWPPFLRRRPIRPDVRRPDSSPEGASRLRDSAGIQPDFAGRRVSGSWPAGCRVVSRQSVVSQSSVVSRQSSARELPVARYPLPARGHPSPVASTRFSVPRCQLPVARSPLGRLWRIAHRVLRLAYCVLRIAHCALRIANYQSQPRPSASSLHSAAHAAAEPDPARRRRCRPRRLGPPSPPLRRHPIRKPNVEAGMKSSVISHQSPARRRSRVRGSVALPAGSWKLEAGSS